MLEELKQHLEELEVIINDVYDHSMSIDDMYYDKLMLFLKKFKFWIPSIYIYSNKDGIGYIFSDCPMYLNHFDDEKQMKNSDYQDQLEEWKWMIESESKDGNIKQIL